MTSRYSKTRLDRFLSVRLQIKRSDVRLLLAEKRIKINGCLVSDIARPVGQFDQVQFDSQSLQHNQPYYFMLNKPMGVVSATKDKQHKTVMDLFSTEWQGKLHIAGRLDFNSTGLMLLTNDGEWSRRLFLPENKMIKRYIVTLEKPVTDEVIRLFSEGIYFAYEDIITRPAALTKLSENRAEVALVEGKYHQIKRMFGRFNNKVLSLHRVAVGALSLDEQLAEGAYRLLTEAELALLRA